MLPPLSRHLVVEGRDQVLLFSGSQLGKAVPDSGHYSTAGVRGCQGSGGTSLAPVPTGHGACCSDPARALYEGGGPLSRACASVFPSSWENLEASKGNCVNLVVSEVAVKETTPGTTPGTEVDQEGGPGREHRGYCLTGRDPDEAGGASVPVTKATACEPLLPSPHPGPSPASLRPPPPPLFCFHGDKRRGPAPNITRCGKHAPRGTPPPQPVLGAEP